MDYIPNKSHVIQENYTITRLLGIASLMRLNFCQSLKHDIKDKEK
jgi:hypothetical protein